MSMLSYCIYIAAFLLIHISTAQRIVPGGRKVEFFNPRNVLPNVFPRAPQNDCKPTNMLKSFFQKMTSRKMACLDAQRKDEIVFRRRNMYCFFSVMARDCSLHENLLNNEIPERAKVQELMFNVLDCTVSDMGFIMDDGSLNTNIFSDKMKAISGADMDTYNVMIQECIDDKGTSSSDALVAIGEITQCALYKFMNHCSSIGQEDDMLPIIHAMNSILLESKCTAKPPPELIDDVLECMDETKMEMENQMKNEMQNSGGSSRFSEIELRKQINNLFRRGRRGRSMMCEFKENVKKAMQMTDKCLLGKLNMLQSDGITIDEDSMKDYIENKITGWTGDNAEKFLKLYSCYDIDEGMNVMEVEKGLKQFKNCFLPEYIQMCGINSDLTDVVFPYAHKRVLEKMMSHMKEKVMDMLPMSLFQRSELMQMMLSSESMETDGKSMQTKESTETQEDMVE